MATGLRKVKTSKPKSDLSNDILSECQNIKCKNKEFNKIKEINDRIKNEICTETIDNLTDINLLDEYKKSKSVKNEIIKLETILDKYHIKNQIKNSIINDYLIELIPPGTKGVIRGNKFNKIIKNTILNMNLDTVK
jgi:hypothetical protein